jgi:hypothetical protein
LRKRAAGIGRPETLQILQKKKKELWAAWGYITECIQLFFVQVTLDQYHDRNTWAADAIAKLVDRVLAFIAPFLSDTTTEFDSFFNILWLTVDISNSVCILGV